MGVYACGGAEQLPLYQMTVISRIITISKIHAFIVSIQHTQSVLYDTCTCTHKQMKALVTV